MKYNKYAIITCVLMVISVYARTSGPGDDTIQHFIGELYGGGVVFYVDNTGKHGLICSMSDIRGSESYPFSRGTYQEPWDRQSNKVTINYKSSSIDYAKKAAKLCEWYTNSDFGTGIFSDWFLPDINQLEIMYKCKPEINKAIKVFDKDAKGLLLPVLYQSSSNWDDDRFQGNFMFDFGSGIRTSTSKPSPYRTINIRAIRTF